MSARVAVEVNRGVADIRLARAEKMNALDADMFEALIAAGDEVRARKDVRAIVLSGEGRAFCAGLDLEVMQSLSMSGAWPSLKDRAYGPANMPQHVVLQWRSMPVPVIAAVHGVAFGGGFQLMLGADMRMVRVDARLALAEIKWGVVPDMGGMLLIRDLVRPDVAMDLVCTGRTISGEEAGRVGLATSVCEDPLAAALALAEEIASKNPHAIRAAKRLLSFPREGAVEQILTAETAELSTLMGSPSQVEAVKSVLEKRAANFTD